MIKFYTTDSKYAWFRVILKEMNAKHPFLKLKYVRTGSLLTKQNREQHITTATANCC